MSNLLSKTNKSVTPRITSRPVNVELEDDAEVVTIFKEKQDDVKMVSAPRGMSGTGRGLRLNTINIRLAYRGGFQSTAGSSYATTIGMNPNLSSEWSSWTATYDEAKIIGADLYWSPAQTFNKQAPADATAIMGLCYDPLNSGSLTTVATAAVHSQAQLFNLQTLNMYQPSSQIAYPSNQVGNRYGVGFVHFPIKCPKGASSSTNNANVRTGQWFSTQDTSTTSGYIKFFIENSATDISYTVQYMLLFRVRLRSRS